MTDTELKPSGAQAWLGGAQAIAAAAPALFAPFSVMALSLDGAPLWAMLLSVLGAAPLTATAGVAASRPLPARSFALACIPLAAVAGWFAWSSGGALSPASPWMFAAMATTAFLGGRSGALIAAGLAVAIGAALILLPEPPVSFVAAAPRAQRELVAVFSWGCATFSVAAAAWAAMTAWTNALPPLRHPTIAARRALSLLVDAASVCALRIDSGGRVAQVLGAAADTLEFPRDQLREAPLAALTHPDDLPALQALIAQALARRAARRGGRAKPRADEAELESSMTLRLRSRLGGYRWLEATVVAASDFPKPPSGVVSEKDVVVVLRARWRPDQDIDAGGELERAGFLAQMDSALRGAANAIVGYTDVMKNELFGPLGAERYREYARLAHESGEQMLELVDELIDLAEIEAGRYAGKSEMIDPVPLIDGVMRLARARAEQAGVALSSDIAPSTPHIRAERRALRRAILKITADAIDRGAMGDSVKLRVALEDGAVRVTLLTTPKPMAEGAAERGPSEVSPALPGMAAESADADGDGAGTTLGEARLGRMVAATLIERLGGTLIFTGGLDDAEAAQHGFTGEADAVYAEALLPAPAPSSNEASQRPDADAIAPKEAKRRHEMRQKLEEEQAAARAKAAAAAPPVVSDVDRPLFDYGEPTAAKPREPAAPQPAEEPEAETALFEEKPDPKTPKGRRKSPRAKAAADPELKARRG